MVLRYQFLTAWFITAPSIGEKLRRDRIPNDDVIFIGVVNYSQADRDSYLRECHRSTVKYAQQIRNCFGEQEYRLN